MKSGDKEKKPKVGPREQQLRDMREARIESNKKLIDKNVREIGKVFNVKSKTTKVRGGSKKTVVKAIKKRGRSR
jgi:hypothetical protein